MTSSTWAVPVELLARQGGVISRQQAIDFGVGHTALERLRRAGVWRSLLAGVYLVDAPLYASSWAQLPFETRLHAALLFHGRDAVLVLDTAARLHGWPGLPGDEGTIHVRLAPGVERHQQPGVRVHTWLVPPEQVVSIEGLRVSSVHRTIADLLRTVSRHEAVSLVDAGLNAGLIDAAGLQAVEDLCSGKRGAVAARERLREADGRAQSVLETRLRLTATDAGYPPHHLQYPVRDRYGVLLGYGDLAYERAARPVLVVEADGTEVHGRPEALYRDRLRANDFVSTGNVDMLRFTWSDLLRRGYVASVLRQNLRAS